MNMMAIVRFVAVVCAGLVAGGYLTYRTGVYYALRELSASGFVQFQQIMHVHFLKFVPPLVVGNMVAVIVWLAMLMSHWTSLEFWLIAAATCGNIAVVAMTVSVNVPLNNKLMTWSAAAPPVDLKELWAPWDRTNTIRTFVSVGVLAIEVAALSLRASRGL
jgi:uncharacterized membrane protein